MGSVLRPRLRPFGLWGRMQAHSCLHLHQSPAHQPQVAQGKHRLQLVVVLGYAPVSGFAEPKLLLDDAKRVLYFGPDAGLGLLVLSLSWPSLVLVSKALRRPLRMAMCQVTLLPMFSWRLSTPW